MMSSGSLPNPLILLTTDSFKWNISHQGLHWYLNKGSWVTKPSIPMTHAPPQFQHYPPRSECVLSEMPEVYWMDIGFPYGYVFHCKIESCSALEKGFCKSMASNLKRGFSTFCWVKEADCETAFWYEPVLHKIPETHLSLYVHILGGVGKKFTTMLVIVFGK